MISRSYSNKSKEYVTIAMGIFSLSLVACYFTWEDIMSKRESSPGVSLVFI